MYEDNLDCTASCQSCRLQVGGLPLGQGLAPRYARVFGPGDRRQGDDGIVQTSPQQAGDSHGKDQSRECKENVGNTHEDCVCAFPVPAAEHPDQSSDGCNDGNQEQG